MWTHRWSFFLHYFRLFTDWISVRWGVGCEMIFDILAPEQRTHSALKSHLLSVKNLSMRSWNIKSNFYSVLLSNPLMIVEFFYISSNLWSVCVSISSYSLRHWVLWSGHKQQHQQPSHRSVWKGAFDCQKGTALLRHFTFETWQQGVQIGSNQLHTHRWNW